VHKNLTLNGLQYFFPYSINFLGASTQTPQGRLPPASQERGAHSNLATLGISLCDASIREYTLPGFKCHAFVDITG